MIGQPRIPPTPAGTSMAGQTAIITGGNAGLGFETARQYLTLKASRVIITVRSESKGQEAISALRADPAVKASNPSAKIEAFILDLEDYQSALRFVQKVKKEVPELHILLCNAGMNIIKYEASKSGHEMVIQVNCYTHFFIAFELLPLLRATSVKHGSPSRLTIVGSIMQTMHTLSKHPFTSPETILGHFDDRKAYNIKRYADSKLAVNAFIRKLATTVSSKYVIVNNVCPGMVATEFDKGLPAYFRVPLSLIRAVRARSVDEGARTLVYATLVAGPESHGKFLQHNKVDPGAPFLDEKLGKEFTEKLWAEIVEDAKSVDPELDVVV
ncbi:putative carbonyl reductase [Stipitochalara longipes BDJ]|nr:putative carbonyl reductase [Stipitochalara longipes BDJ]